MPKQYNNYIKYSGMAMQMAVSIYAGHWLGEFIDEKTNNDSGLYAKIITLVAVFLSTFLIIREVIKSNSDE
ncbi:AtpZ/AtpI family protein [Fulvivirga sediminis]|uniref:AtpZ/AtpI family protein n=1 Tax=Fulvivirga sediminis TaxID=2803949 RepID=A0A937K1Q4_9BACT|nr:AtpZ/AtpI family protein [Fulvivirga sediminis]MBL3657746.1 AtpZ/AtpI family protein [Fulvivirga sediminis]